MVQIVKNSVDAVFRQRKFTLAMVLCIGGTVGLFTGSVSGGEYAALATGLMGAYGWANVQDSKG